MSYLDDVTDDDIAMLMQQAFSAVDDVCSQLEAGDWDLTTDLPGWSVKDNLAHLAHFEAVLCGRDHDDIEVPEYPHIRDDFQKANEQGVEARRKLSGPQVLEEFREVTAERAKTLASYGEQEWGGEVPSPFGMMPARKFIPIRILDVFYHEQDIRRAVNKPGHMNGGVARFVFERFASTALPRVIAKQAQAPDGSVVVFEVPAPGRTIALRVQDGKAHEVEPPKDPTVRFTLDFEAHVCLLGGRKTPQWLRDEGRFEITGDQDLAGRILQHISVTP